MKSREAVLVYYDYIDLSGASKPLIRFNVALKDDHEKYSFFKINEHSKIGWCRSYRKKTDKFGFKCYSLHSDRVPGEPYKVSTSPKQINLICDVVPASFTVSSIWEISKNSYFVCT